MDLTPIFYAALAATGSDPNADEHDAADLEKAQRALWLVGDKISEALGDIKLAEITITDEPSKHP